MGRSAGERVRQDVVALCGGTLDRQSLYEQLTDALQRLVGFDGSCWHTIDPRTTLITGHRTQDLPDPEHGFPLLCANEYLMPDLNKFADLARGPRRAAVLSQAAGGHPEKSLRYREFLRPNGLDGELRAAFTDGTSCWGSLILVRAPGRDFDPADAELLGALARPIARAMRRSLLVDAIRRDPLRSPGLVVVGPAGQVETMTGPARHWLRLLAEPAGVADEAWLPPAVHAVVATVRRTAGTVRLAAHTASGSWVELHGAVAEGGSSGRVAVILAAAADDLRVPNVLAAAGLTPREQQVVALVTDGLATKQIAGRLQLSAYTVQDHLRAVFEKLGVHSKQELAAQVFFRDQLPRIEAGAAPEADGTLTRPLP